MRSNPDKESLFLGFSYYVFFCSLFSSVFHPSLYTSDSLFSTVFPISGAVTVPMSKSLKIKRTERKNCTRHLNALP